MTQEQLPHKKIINQLKKLETTNNNNRILELQRRLEIMLLAKLKADQANATSIENI